MGKLMRPIFRRNHKMKLKKTLEEHEMICSRCSGSGQIVNPKKYFHLKAKSESIRNLLRQPLFIRCPVCLGEKKLDWVENIMGKRELGYPPIEEIDNILFANNNPMGYPCSNCVHDKNTCIKECDSVRSYKNCFKELREFAMKFDITIIFSTQKINPNGSIVNLYYNKKVVPGGRNIKYKSDTEVKLKILKLRKGEENAGNSIKWQL